MTSNTHETPGRDKPRNAWRDAIWEADLPGMTKLVALVYADHASADGIDVWVTPSRGVTRAGVKLTAWRKHLRTLVGTGWLIETRAATSRSTPEYRLAIPKCRDAQADYRETSAAYREPIAETVATRHQPPTGLPSPSPSTSSPAAAETPDGSAVATDPTIANTVPPWRVDESAWTEGGHAAARDQLPSAEPVGAPVSHREAAPAASARFTIAKRTRKGPLEPGDLAWLALADLADGESPDAVSHLYGELGARLPVVVRPWTADTPSVTEDVA